MSCTIAYKLCTAFSILTFESVVDFRNLLKDIYNSLFLIQVKHDSYNSLIFAFITKMEDEKSPMPCLALFSNILFEIVLLIMFAVIVKFVALAK